jgi:hypothetical protein
VRQFLPDWTAFFSLGPDSWLWGWWAGPGESPLHEREDEKRLGVGLMTTLACGLGLYIQRDRPAIRLLLGTALVLVVCVLTISRGLVQGVCLTLILLVLADASKHRTAPIAMHVLAPGLLLGFLKVNQPGSDEIIGAALFGLFVVAADAYRNRDDLPRCLALAAVGGGLALWLFALVTLAYGAALGALVGSAAAVAGVRPRRRVGLIATVVLLLFASLTAYGYRPAVLKVACLAPLFLTVVRFDPHAFPPRWSLGMLITALMATFVYQVDDTAWSFVAAHVPGAAALHAVGRVGVVLLVLWSIGLANFVERLTARGHTPLALGIALACLVEQGVTTPSYDKDENRRTIAAIARRVDRRDAAFFYSPHHALMPPWKYHIDAMWASLECGVPTINGYSGNRPRGWGPLSDPNIAEECDFLCLAVPLRRWIEQHHLEHARVGWIGGPEDWRTAAGRR